MGDLYNDELTIHKPQMVFTNKVIEEEQQLFANSNLMEAPGMKEQENISALDLKKLGFSEKLKASLAVLADDKNKASAYFKPVVESEKKVLSGCKSKEELGREMGNLLEKVCYYLDNRPSSKLSPQRRQRRAACESVMNDIGRFLYDADETVADQVATKVRTVQKPDKASVSRMDQFCLDYGYVISHDFVETKYAKADFMKLVGKSGVKEISQIYHYMDGLDSLLTNNMPPVPKSKSKKAAYADEIRMVGFGISNMYKGIIDACNKALANDSASPEEQTILKNLLKGYTHDSKVFANGISQYAAGKTDNEVVTWKDAIATKGATGVQLEAEGVTKMGAGTSVVYKFKTKGKNKYFKEEEKSSKNLNESWKTIRTRIRKMPGYNPAFEAELKKFEEVMEKQLENSGKIGFTAPRDNKDFVRQYFNFLITLRRANGKGLNNKAKNVKKEVREKYPLMKYLSELDATTDASKLILQVTDDFLKKYNADMICGGSAKINAGSTISNRNVATSRMADLLNIPDLVLHSETTEVIKGNKVVVGNVMDEAVGNEAGTIYRNGAYKYTSKTVGQMSVMQIFDLICGQVDRNYSNYYLQTKNGLITGVSMIDNDLAFGNITKIDDPKTMRMVGVNSMVLDSLPVEFIDAVKKLGTLSVKDLGFFFGDILKEDEMDSLKTRIDYICEQIYEREEHYKTWAKEGTKEQKKIAKNMKDNDFRSYYFQYNLYRKVIDYENEHPDEKVDFNKKIREFSYLNGDNMMDYQRVKMEYQIFM